MDKYRPLRAILLIQMAMLLVNGRRLNFCGDKSSSMYADPDNCAGFYHCFMKMTYYYDCPPGLFFNINYHVCDWPSNVDCDQKGSSSWTSSSQPTSEQTTLASTFPTTTSLKPFTSLVLSFAISDSAAELLGTTGPSETLNGTVVLSGITTTNEAPKITVSLSGITTTNEAPKITAPLSGITTTNNALKSRPTVAMLTITIPENATLTTKTPLATFCQNKPDDLYADPNNCDSFYQCHGSTSYHFTCQVELVFNPDQRYCDWEWNVNCSAPRDNRNRSQVNLNDGNSQTMPALETEIVNRTSAAKCDNVVCYFPNWAVHRHGFGARFGPENINPELCTHIIYAFSTLRGNRLIALDPADEARGSDIGNFARVTNLKLRNPELKVLLAVGGWNMDLSLFSNMAANQESRVEFINTTIEFLRSRHFDGLDLDWEYPGSTYGPDNKERYARLCEELRSAFDKEASGVNRLLLTGAVAAGRNNIDASYNVPRLAASFDIINVMSYDLHGSWDRRSGHPSPLKAGSWEINEEAYLNIEWVANYWVSLGAPKSKLAIGVSLYARTFTLTSTSNTGVGAPSTGPGLPGQYTSESGYLSYYEVCTMFNHSTTYVIPDQRVSYLVSGNQWVGYDDITSIREKVQFIADSGFGGIMVWDLSLDDFSGRFCGQGTYPLMNVIVSQCATRYE